MQATGIAPRCWPEPFLTSDHIDQLVAEGDLLVARWRMTATHSGDLNGPTMTIPATGRSLDIWRLSMYRIRDGMAVEIWERLDSVRS